jgi:hypothetical protein
MITPVVSIIGSRTPEHHHTTHAKESEREQKEKRGDQKDKAGTVAHE